MKVGIPKEIAPGERRVAATPQTVAKMRKLGLEVVVQAGAGEAADHADGAYLETGAEIAPDAETVWSQADIVLKVRAPTLGEEHSEADLLKEGAALIAFIWPGQNPTLVERLGQRKATVLSMDAVPRITRAQKMDALSAMANLVGYRAVVEAASLLGRIFGGQMTAAGRVAPANVLIVGAGVAGLAAIAAAKGLGASVLAFDTRAAVREQVESLGAKFLEMHFEESGEGEGGYAKEMSEAFVAAEQALIAQHAKSSDVVITTALVPGRPAPVLLTSGAVVSMAAGSVIVDLAAEQGGNCPLTERDKLVEKFGKKIFGFTDLPSRMARQASDLYAMTVYNLLEDVYDEKAGKIELDLEDEVHRGAVVLQAGKLLWPPPTKPRPQSAAPQPENKKSAPVVHAAAPAHAPSKAGPWLALVLAGLFTAAGLLAGGEFVQHLTVFLLACVVGWHVIWNVNPALHTPLMSVTNAISGIILVGGILLMRSGGGASGISVVMMLAAVAVLIATINVAGGFLVTQRMLRMFRAMIGSIASVQRLAYLGAALLFIFSLRGLSTQESARRGNAFGIFGMVLAVVVTAFALQSGGAGASGAATTPTDAWGVLAVAIAVGATIGALLAARVAMTSMPELVAILHSFVGAAAVLVGIANYLEPGGETGGSAGVHSVEIVVGVFIGAITFAGSVIAFGKLRGSLSSKPLLLPGRHIANAAMVLACIVLGGMSLGAPSDTGLYALLGITGIACVLGAHLVLAIGGGDMPVVVSMLNSYSGWAAAAAGFMLSNDLLIVTGALVGSSGAILSIIMCRAMNRSIWNVVFGGFGAAPPKGSAQKGPTGPVHEATVPQVADMLATARSVIIVPGYGMAVAQAQHPVKELTTLLLKRGTKVRYAIHPVAGRLPGHMNVLLAEADVSYDLVKEMDEINDEFGDTDVAIIIGANDIVNPSALTDTTSPIYGMPVLEVWKAARVVMMKRSMNAGYAGVDNPLSYRDNTLMLFGDAKQTVGKLVTALQTASSEAA